MHHVHDIVVIIHTFINLAGLLLVYEPEHPLSLVKLLEAKYDAPDWSTLLDTLAGWRPVFIEPWVCGDDTFDTNTKQIVS